MRLSLLLPVVGMVATLGRPSRADTISLADLRGPATATTSPSLSGLLADDPIRSDAPLVLVSNGCNNCGCNPGCNYQSCCPACNGCSSGCCSGNCCGNCCCKKLLGVFIPSDRSFADFISPMTNPVYFEDPRTLTEARVIVANNEIPGPVLGGGDVQLLAAQLRAALTKRLSIIATKDGYMFNAGGPPINGWMNVNLGAKYNLYANAQTQRLLSAAVIYELPVGSTHALQGNGDGVIDLTLTGGTQIGQLWHLVSAGGFRLPTDPHKQNSNFWWSTHIDRRLQNAPLYGFFECNLYHWLSNAQSGVPGVEGLDLYNLGSNNVAGSTIVTGAIGTKYRFGQMNEIGVAWEVPLTNRRDIIDNRIQANLILRY